MAYFAIRTFIKTDQWISLAIRLSNRADKTSWKRFMRPTAGTIRPIPRTPPTPAYATPALAPAATIRRLNSDPGRLSDR